MTTFLTRLIAVGLCLLFLTVGPAVGGAPPETNTQIRVFNVDRRDCNDPSRGWERVASGVSSQTAANIIRDGIEYPETVPHVYRAYHVDDNPGP